jgi:5-methylcytosine-specific restriction endonuclease McrA
MSNKNLKEQIITLKQRGLSYKDIQKQLNCSKGTISYHLGEGQKEKTYNRTIELRKQNTLLQKKDHFLGARTKKNFQERTRAFQCIDNGSKTSDKIQSNFTWQELLEKFNGTCYLTGRPVDITKSAEYQLDHIVPRSKGGPDTLDNCEFACKDANFAKSNLSLDEFKQLCLDVVNHFGLK